MEQLRSTRFAILGEARGGGLGIAATYGIEGGLRDFDPKDQQSIAEMVLQDIIGLAVGLGGLLQLLQRNFPQLHLLLEHLSTIAQNASLLGQQARLSGATS